jgi:hypothetical protein
MGDFAVQNESTFIAASERPEGTQPPNESRV